MFTCNQCLSPLRFRGRDCMLVRFKYFNAMQNITNGFKSLSAMQTLYLSVLKLRVQLPSITMYGYKDKFYFMKTTVIPTKSTLALEFSFRYIYTIDDVLSLNNARVFLSLRRIYPTFYYRHRMPLHILTFTWTIKTN